MSFFVYILRCADGTFYTGHTDDLERRMAEHDAGTFEGYTSLRKPLKLMWSQEFPTRDEAIQRERQVKGWSRAKKEALIRDDCGKVSAEGRKKPKS